MFYALIAWKYIRIVTLYKNMEYVVVNIDELNLRLHSGKCMSDILREKIESAFP